MAYSRKEFEESEPFLQVHQVRHVLCNVYNGYVYKCLEPFYSLHTVHFFCHFDPFFFTTVVCIFSSTVVGLIFLCMLIATLFRDQLGIAWAVVKSRTHAWSVYNMTRLNELNSEFADWLEVRLPHCATYIFMSKAVTRRGMVSTNPAEQNNSSVVPERAMPIIDLIQGLLRKMARNCRERSEIARARVRTGSALVPRAEMEHKIEIAKARKCYVQLEVVTQYEVEATVNGLTSTFFAFPHLPVTSVVV